MVKKETPAEQMKKLSSQLNDVFKGSKLQKTSASIAMGLMFQMLAERAAKDPKLMDKFKIKDFTDGFNQGFEMGVQMMTEVDKMLEELNKHGGK